MRTRFTTTLALSLLIATTCAARAATDYPRHEVWLGFGGAAAFEKSVFNIPNDIASTPDVAINLGYTLNLDARRAVGFYMYGGSEATPSILLQTSAGSRPASFDLNTYNLGVRYRHVFVRGALVPYVFVGGSLVAGGASEAQFGNLSCTGVSACAGPGASMRLGRNFMLSAEGIGSFGVATWERAPFASSSGKNFNPSLVGGTVNLSVVWGTKPASRPVTPSQMVKDSSLARSRRAPSAGAIILNEAIVALYSSAAYDNEKGLLPGLTLATGFLGVAAGQESKSPRTPWIVLGGTLVISTAEFVMANNGASKTALFVTSMVSWNAVILAVARAERNAGRSARKRGSAQR